MSGSSKNRASVCMLHPRTLPRMFLRFETSAQGLTTPEQFQSVCVCVCVGGGGGGGGCTTLAI